jgi:type IX secretion system PorP/SprF family membrane protein
MRKHLLLLLAASALVLPLHAQQRMQYSQYLLNAFLINPAVAGAEQYGELRTGYSHQWAGFKGAPRAGYLSYQQGLFPKPAGGVTPATIERVTSLPTIGRERLQPTTETATSTDSTFLCGSRAATLGDNFHLGVGGTVFSEVTGPLSISGLGGAVSAHIRVAGTTRLSIGAGLEMLNYRLDPRKLNLVNDNDIAVGTNVANLLLPSLNAGFTLYNRRFFLAGATRQLLQNRVQVNPLNPVISNLELHYVLQGGFRFDVSPDLAFTPSVIFRYVDPAPPSIDLSLQANYRELLLAGISYRHRDALVAMLGIRLNNGLLLQYAYDYTTSNLRRFSAGTHSIVLGLRLGTNKMEKKQYFW